MSDFERGFTDELEKIAALTIVPAAVRAAGWGVRAAKGAPKAVSAIGGELGAKGVSSVFHPLKSWRAARGYGRGGFKGEAAKAYARAAAIPAGTVGAGGAVAGGVGVHKAKKKKREEEGE